MRWFNGANTGLEWPDYISNVYTYLITILKKVNGLLLVATFRYSVLGVFPLKWYPNSKPKFLIIKPARGEIHKLAFFSLGMVLVPPVPVVVVISGVEIIPTPAARVT